MAICFSAVSGPQPIKFMLVQVLRCPETAAAVCHSTVSRGLLADLIGFQAVEVKTSVVCDEQHVHNYVQV